MAKRKADRMVISPPYLMTQLTVTGATTISGDATFSGATAGVRRAYASVGATPHAVTAAMSGTVFVTTIADVVFTLPATVAGLTYTFIVNSLSGGTGMLIRPVAADKIQGKGITPADDKDWINSGGSDAIGDMVTIVGDGTDGWWVVEERGTWAREA